jgi:NAD(P)-dependent dehydrogenase (short-subunit alcohol dehydrogenase family)
VQLALVTGTSRGLGKAVAARLLEHDWTVLGMSRSAPPSELSGAHYRHVSIDLSNLDAVQSICNDAIPTLLAEGCTRLGLVNNAGVLAPMGPLPELDPEALHVSWVVNVLTPVLLMGACVRHGGSLPVRIVNLSSGAATDAYPGWAAYCAGKAALRMADQVLATELEEVPGLQGRDVAVVSYAPNVVRTRMQEEIRNMAPARFPRLQKFVDLHESGSLVEPEAPAAEICDLLSADHLPPWSDRRYLP